MLFLPIIDFKIGEILSFKDEVDVLYRVCEIRKGAEVHISGGDILWIHVVSHDLSARSFYNASMLAQDVIKYKPDNLS